MKKSTRDGMIFNRFCKAENHLISQINGPEQQPQPKPLAHGCDYPLFQFNRVSQDVMRRRAIVRG